MDYRYLAIGLIMITLGFLKMATGRVSRSALQKYEPNSLFKFAKKSGIAYIILGLAGLAMTFSYKYNMVVALALIVVAAAVYIFFRLTILEKYV